MKTITHETINIRQFTLGSIFKIGFLSNLFFWGIPSVILGILAIFNTSPEVVAGITTTHGVSGFFSIVFSSVIASVIAAGILTLGALGARWASNELPIGTLIYALSPDQVRKKKAFAQKRQKKPNKSLATPIETSTVQNLENVEKKKGDIPEGRLW